MQKLATYGAKSDPHVARVAEALARRGVELYVLNPISTNRGSWRLGNLDKCRLLFVGANHGEMEADPRELLFWLRNKRSLVEIKTAEDQCLYLKLAEAKVFLYILLKTYGIRHFNRLPLVGNSEDKLFQLRLARNLGLLTPPSLISARAEDVKSFRGDFGELVCKPLSVNLIPAFLDGLAMSFTIFAKPLRACEDVEPYDFSQHLAIYQANVEKKCELRVIATSLGATATYAIDPQSSTKGTQDWRLAQRKNTFSESEMDSETASRIVQYLSGSDLSYGVFDFIVTPREEVVFLECNSDGQWAWLEDRAGKKKITEMFANLIESKRS